MAPREHVLITDRGGWVSPSQPWEKRPGWDLHKALLRVIAGSLLGRERARQRVHSRRAWGPLGPGSPLLLTWMWVDHFFPGPIKTHWRRAHKNLDSQIAFTSVLKQLPLHFPPPKKKKKKKCPRFILLDSNFPSRKSSKLNIESLLKKKCTVPVN